MNERNNLTRDEARARAALVHDIRYRIDLDLTDEDTFGTETVCRFGCRDPGGATHLELTAPRVTSIELNGEPVPLDAFDGHRVHLTGLAEANELRVVARGDYHRTELGMHRFVDPVDGRTYLHTDFEPFDAHRVFACFDQPDLKGTFEFHVTTPAGWEVVASSPAAGPPAVEGGVARWSFQTSPLLPTYVTCVCAGEWHVVRDRHRDIDLGLYCRASLAEHLEPDELFEITKQGLDFFEPAFGVPYPFGKYDQIFVPESNSGAMENAGCVTFNDLYVFRSRVTDAYRESRAETILHEMAHMWFGNLVTMQWWNDLWLNESFATYMSMLAEVEATRFTRAWTTFAGTQKLWAYRQDQLPTTHPIVAEVPDAQSTLLNFDGITYAKGASVLKQLVAWVGQDRFLEGVKRYTGRHAYGNAELADFLAALEETSGRDLHSWSKEWLEAPGVNTLRADIETTAEGSFASFALIQEAPPDWPTIRSHRVAVGLYDAGPEGMHLRRRVEFDAVGERTEVTDLAGERVPDLTLINDGDLTFAKIRLDERSLAAAVDRVGDLEDPLARALCWSACWDMTRDGEMRARDYVRLVTRNIGREHEIGLAQSLLAQANSAIHLYGDPARRQTASEEFAEACLDGMKDVDAGSDHQLAWARAFASASRSEQHLGLARALLDGEEAFDGLAMDTDLRWHFVRALAAGGAIGEDHIEAEGARDPSDRGRRRAAGARAARPDPEAKRRAWERVVGDPSLPLALTEEIMSGFQQFDQEDLLAPYAERYFDALTEVWESRDPVDALAFAGAMFPFLIVDPATVELGERRLAQDSVPDVMRRPVIEGTDGVARALRARAKDAAG